MLVQISFLLTIITENIYLMYLFSFSTKTKVQLLIEDNTSEMELMVFGNKIEKLTGAIFSQLIALSQMDRMIIPRPVLALKNQMRKI